jgi:hypothetical protein
MIARMLRSYCLAERPGSVHARNHVFGEIQQGALLMKLRTICAVATIFMAFFTVAVWKSPMRGEY